MSERRPILSLGGMSRYLIADCVVCDDVGCEFCAAVVEPWPSETFAALGTVDLQQLVADASSELVRRGVCGAVRNNNRRAARSSWGRERGTAEGGQLTNG